MLYNTFLVCMMITSVFGILHMVDNQNMEYIIFPIAFLVAAVFKFFDANDRKYLEDLGINPDEFNAFFPDYYDNYSYNHRRGRNFGASRDNSIYAPGNDTKVNGNTITWDNPKNTEHRTSPMYRGGFGFGDDSRYMPRRYQNPTYKGMTARCKRNFKISIHTEEKDESTERVLSTTSRAN